MTIWIWIVLLQLLSLILLVAEVFLPSAGILTGLTAGAAIGSVWMAYGVSSAAGWTLLCVDLIVLPLVGWKALSLIPRSPIALRDTLDGKAGEESLDDLLGQEGIAETDLRPVGRVRLSTRSVDAQMNHGYLERGRTVRVVKSEGGHIFVEPV